MEILKKSSASEANILAAQALAAEDFEEASNALLLLKRKDRKLTQEVASKILREHIGDVFYRAFAFEMLYSVALNDAVAYIESEAGIESTYVLGAMLGAVTEDAAIATEQREVLKAVQALRTTLLRRSKEDRNALASKIEQFEVAYGSNDK